MCIQQTNLDEFDKLIFALPFADLEHGIPQTKEAMRTAATEIKYLRLVRDQAEKFIRTHGGNGDPPAEYQKLKKLVLGSQGFDSLKATTPETTGQRLLRGLRSLRDTLRSQVPLAKRFKVTQLKQRLPKNEA